METIKKVATENANNRFLLSSNLYKGRKKLKTNKISPIAIKEILKGNEIVLNDSCIIVGLKNNKLFIEDVFLLEANAFYQFEDEIFFNSIDIEESYQIEKIADFINEAIESLYINAGYDIVDCGEFWEIYE